jgi:HNH endonuclease
VRAIAYVRAYNEEKRVGGASDAPTPDHGSDPLAAKDSRFPTFVGIPLFAKDGSVRAWAMVDVEDADLGRHRWYLGSRGYAMRQLKQPGRNSTWAEFLHRRILGLDRGDPRQSDHINRDKMDNRRANLRIVTQTQNNQNLPGGHGRAGHYGVHWIEERNKWAVRIIINGKWVWGGYFTDPEEAARHAEQLRARVSPFSFEAWKAE